LKKFIVEGNIAGLGELTSDELGLVAKEANAALAVMPGIQWLHSYIAYDKAFSDYLAEHESLVREHVIATGFPVAKISEVTDVIDPSFEGFALEQGGKSSRQTVTEWFARNRTRAA
jgi:hypothetical protein